MSYWLALAISQQYLSTFFLIYLECAAFFILVDKSAIDNAKSSIAVDSVENTRFLRASRLCEEIRDTIFRETGAVTYVCVCVGRLLAMQATSIVHVVHNASSEPSHNV